MKDPPLGGDVRAVLAVAALLTVGGTLAGDATLGMVLTPVVVMLLMYAMSRVPIRQSMLALAFFAFTLPNPAEGHPWGEWNPPFTQAGALLLVHWNAVNRSIPLPFSGLDIAFATLGVIILMRKVSGSKIDSTGRAATPRPLIQLAWISLAGTAFVWLNGLARGGDFRMSLWQINSVMYVPVVFSLFQHGLRGPKDLRAVGRVLLAAATYKGLLATYVYYAIKLPPDPDTGSTHVVFATTHADSMLFADAFVLIVLLFVERVKKKSVWLMLLMLGIFTSGMIANNRRLAWVHVSLTLVAVYFVTADNPVKRAIRKGLAVAAPIFALYVAAGWNSGGGLTFKPVRMLRSVVDAKSDGSSLWRELENYDIISTIKANPIFGVGYGHGYDEVIVLPFIDYDLERYCPHNSILGLWAYCGYVGFALLTMFWVVAIYLAIRAYNATTDAVQRTAAIASVSTILIYLMHCWGDLGLSTWTGVFSTSISIAVAAKLSVATGGWTASSTGKRRTAPSAQQYKPGVRSGAPAAG
jgi:O-antigen ligase